MKTAQSALMSRGNIFGQMHPSGGELLQVHSVLVALQMRDGNLMDGVIHIQVASGSFPNFCLWSNIFITFFNFFLEMTYEYQRPVPLFSIMQPTYTHI